MSFAFMSDQPAELAQPHKNSGTDTALTPAQVVKKLDEYIIGQESAKRAVAIAYRNRWRRERISQEMRNEVIVIRLQFLYCNLCPGNSKEYINDWEYWMRQD